MFSKKIPTRSVLNRQYQAGRNNRNLMQNTNLFWILFHVLKVLLIKIIRCSDHFLYFLLFRISFTSADIFFYKFLELHSTLPEKGFCHEFFFINKFTLAPTHFMRQNPLSMTKVFCRCSLIGEVNFLKALMAPEAGRYWNKVRHGFK